MATTHIRKSESSQTVSKLKVYCVMRTTRSSPTKILHRFIDCLNVLAVGKMITSRSPGTAFEFALTIVEHLVGTEKKESLIDQMLLKM